jgi:hypothetical protein
VPPAAPEPAAACFRRGERLAISDFFIIAGECVDAALKSRSSDGRLTAGNPNLHPTESVDALALNSTC